MSTASRRRDALKIWQAGVAAVDSKRLVQNSIQVDDVKIVVSGAEWHPNDSSRVCVVGAGKAGAGMAVGVEDAFGEKWRPRISGWVNVPEDCVRSLNSIHLHGARPAGVNEPTEAGVAGTEEILRCVGELNENDLCVVLISGGGSALLPAPISGIRLEEKQQITRELSAAGATIQELNCLRRALSRVKGGGLLRACRVGTLVSLIISDVIGDPLETIASGPTVNVSPDPMAALTVLQKYGLEKSQSSVIELLSEQSQKPKQHTDPLTLQYSNHIIGNNQTAVEVAVSKAKKLGYTVCGFEFDQPGEANEFGYNFAKRCLEVRDKAQPGEKLCLISGGEPTVQLAKTNGEQKGGRNQQLVLSAAKVLDSNNDTSVTILSGGTDGEDGPTDAAGAWIDSELLKVANNRSLVIDDYLAVNNSYRYFEAIDGLIKTGPTHTNVMDLRVALIEPMTSR